MRLHSSLAPVLLLAACCGAGGCARAGFTVPAADLASDSAGRDGDGDGADADADAEAGPADGGPDGPLPSGAHLWARRLGHAGAVEEILLAADVGGGIIVAGTMRGLLDLGGGDLTSSGGTDLFIASFAADGAHRWSHTLGNGEDQRARAVAAAPDGGLLVAARYVGALDLGGGVLPDLGDHGLLLASFAADGTHRWSRSFAFNGANEGIASIAADQSGDVFVTGPFSADIDLGGAGISCAGAWDIFLASFAAADGAHRWSAGFGGDSVDETRDIAVGPGGAVFISGNHQTTIDLGGGPLVSAGGSDMLVASFDGDGDHRWSQRFGGGSDDTAASIAVAPGGAVLVGGEFSGTVDLGGGDLTSAGSYDIVLASFDGSSGAHNWSRAFGGADLDWAEQVAVDAAGNVFVSGVFQQSVDFGGGDLTAAGFSALFAASFTDAGAHRWSKSLGGPSSDHAPQIAAAAGDLALAGTALGAVDLGGGVLAGGESSKAFIGRLAGADGAHVWSRAESGESATDRVDDVAVDAEGNVVVTGRHSGAVNVGGDDLTSAGGTGVLLASFGGDGAHRWSHTLGGPAADWGHGVALDPGGNTVVVGRFSEVGDFGGAPLTSKAGIDIFVASYGADGAHRWSRSYGGGGNDWARRIAIGADGRLLVAGGFQQTVDFGGASHLTSAGGDDAFISSHDDGGKHHWTRTLGDAGSDWAAGVAVDSSGNVYATGRFKGTIDAGGGELTATGGHDLFVVSYTTDGVHRWSRVFGGGGSDEGRSIAVAPGGAVLVTGSYTEPFAFGSEALTSSGAADVFVASLDAVDGSPRWSRGYGSAGDDDGLGVAVAADGAVFVTGRFSQTITFGGTALPSAGDHDIFLVSLDAAGTHLWSARFGGRGVDQGSAIAVTGSAVVVTGQFAERVDFGGGPLHSAGAGFVAAFVR